ncbi:hypothetical protein KP509_17G046000 [Ceratopteris richardii]|uniref:CRM domain-containing protein n=1 Tax=Ceratopteris richardii TaxID=49495 RepID=A0A8T2SUP3_CERRI|nr:hypothetical protein KP509_17G046000 [Ceratopteris richardii]
MAISIARKRSNFLAAAVQHTHRFLCSFSTAAASQPSNSLPREPIKGASALKRPRSSPAHYKLGLSRASRQAEAAVQRAAVDPHQQRLEQVKRVRKEKKKKRQTPVFEDLTPSQPLHSDLPFAFRYSYTEVPKIQPIRFQEKYSPFGPGRLNRPWDGQEALPVEASSRKVKLNKDRRKHVIDSLNPPTKKGIKPIAPPGPFLPGTGPKDVKAREEILGEPLTKEETEMLILESRRSKKQLNIGRDGLTHNLLICIYDYWTRERVVRVKCMGVATVDMDNIVFQIEDKTGGKVIHRAGGTLHVFRGRYYNNKYRPNIPKMLWRPHSPIYPKLVVETPGGLKRQEANALRKRGHDILPICKIAKNGFYGDLVAMVREGFQEDDLVRIDCKAVDRHDYKKIGAKLRDLVPCVILSFQDDQMLLWKGREGKETVENELSVSSNFDGLRGVCEGNNDMICEKGKYERIIEDTHISHVDEKASGIPDHEHDGGDVRTTNDGSSDQDHVGQDEVLFASDSDARSDVDDVLLDPHHLEVNEELNEKFPEADTEDDHSEYEAHVISTEEEDGNDYSSANEGGKDISEDEEDSRDGELSEDPITFSTGDYESSDDGECSDEVESDYSHGKQVKELPDRQ